MLAIGVVAVVALGVALWCCARPPVGPTTVAVPHTCTWDGTLTAPLTYDRRGLFLVRVEVHVDGAYRATACVVDTGSRHLTVAAASLGLGASGTLARPVVDGPDRLTYGPPPDGGRWHRVPVRMGNTRVCHDLQDVALAVTHRRTCAPATCCDVLGLAGGTGTPPPFLHQLGKRAFRLQLRRHGGQLRLNDATLEGTRLPRLPHSHLIVLRLRGLGTRRRGGPLRLLAGVPDRVMVDTGSNMLGCTPAVARALTAAVDGGGHVDLVLVLEDAVGQPHEHVVGPTMYRHGGKVLVDAAQGSPMVTLGSLFLVGHDLTVTPEAVALRRA